MGQKVNPNGLRIGINKTWLSTWYHKKNYADMMLEDFKIRKSVEKALENAEVEKVEIVRYPDRVTVNIHSARPGIVIGKKGADLEKLKASLQKLTPKKMQINIIEVKQAKASAILLARGVAKQIEGRIPHKRAMKQAISNAVESGVKGVKITVSGRLGGAEMARRESYKEGRIPLHTLRADIDYATATANTTFGCIGVKVWLFKGEILGKEVPQQTPNLLYKKRGEGSEKTERGERSEKTERGERKERGRGTQRGGTREKRNKTTREK